MAMRDFLAVEAIANIWSERERGAMIGFEEDGKRIIEEGEHFSTPVGPQNHFGVLHRRHVDASPEKFTSGRFEPLSLCLASAIATQLAPSPARRAKLSDQVEILHDPSDSPQLTPLAAIQEAARQQSCPSTIPMTMLPALATPPTSPGPAPTVPATPFRHTSARL